jgi:uncharacterized membrane protein YbhN (UPF0104 family)
MGGGFGRGGGRRERRFGGRSGWGEGVSEIGRVGGLLVVIVWVFVTVCSTSRGFYGISSSPSRTWLWRRVVEIKPKRSKPIAPAYLLRRLHQTLLDQRQVSAGRYHPVIPRYICRRSGGCSRLPRHDDSGVQLAARPRLG